MQKKSLTTSHKQTNDQQVSRQQPPWKTSPPLLLTWVLLLSLLYSTEYTCDQFGSFVLAVSPPSFLSTPSLFAGVGLE